MDALAVMQAGATARRNIDSALDSIAEMKEREGIKGQSYEPHVKGTVNRDVMARVDARIDRERNIEGYIAENQPALDLCEQVILGVDTQFGAGGFKYSDTLWSVYLLGMTFKELSQTYRETPKKLREYHDVAIDMIDSMGIARMKELGRPAWDELADARAKHREEMRENLKRERVRAEVEAMRDQP